MLEYGIFRVGPPKSEGGKRLHRDSGVVKAVVPATVVVMVMVVMVVVMVMLAVTMVFDHDIRHLGADGLVAASAKLSRAREDIPKPTVTIRTRSPG
jgi:hypothetical protein